MVFVAVSSNYCWLVTFGGPVGGIVADALVGSSSGQELSVAVVAVQGLQVGLDDVVADSSTSWSAGFVARC